MTEHSIAGDPQPETEVPPRVEGAWSSSLAPSGHSERGCGQGRGCREEGKGEKIDEEDQNRLCCSCRLTDRLGEVIDDDDDIYLCLKNQFVGFVACVLAWYCFGLSFFIAPIGLTSHVPMPDQARNANYLTPAAFYLLFAGRFIGGMIFGQFGDRYRRQVALALCLLLIGLTTLAMGLYPFHEPGADRLSVGWAALRFLQGVGVGGQWPGTILLALESCHNERHGALAAGISHSGVFLGLGLAAGAAYQLMGQDGGGNPMRKAFWIAGGLIMPVAVWVYFGDSEVATFEDVQEGGGISRYSWWAMVKLNFWTFIFGWITLSIDALAQSLLIFQWPLILPHGSGPGPHGRQSLTNSPAAAAKDVHGCVAMGLLATAIMTIVSAFLRERFFSRCLLYRLGAFLTCLGLWIWFFLAAGTVRRHKPLAWLFGGYLLVLGPGLGTMQGPLAALVAEPFPSSIAYAGLGFAYHTVHSAMGAAFPSLTNWLLVRGSSEIVLILSADIRPIYLAVAVLIVTILCMYTTSFLKGSQRRSILSRTQGLRVRDCIGLSTNRPSSVFRLTASGHHTMPLPTMQQSVSLPTMQQLGPLHTIQQIGNELPCLEEDTKR